MIHFRDTKITRFQSIWKSTFFRFTLKTVSGKVSIHEDFLKGNAETKVGRRVGWLTSQLLQLYTQHKWEDVNILGSSKWQFGVWGLFIKDKLDNCPHWALTLMMEVGRLGKRTCMYLSISHFFPLVGNVSSFSVSWHSDL